MFSKIRRYWWEALTFGIVILGVVLPFLLQYLYFNTLIISDVKMQGELGPISDWVSGMVTPCIALSSFILLYKTYQTQKEELALTRKEMAESRRELAIQGKTALRQRFENTFFNMIELYNQNIKGLEFKGYSGRLCFKEAYDVFYEYYKMINEGSWPVDGTKPQKEIEKIARAYDDILYIQSDKTIFSQYWGNIYQILKLIHDSDLDKEEKKFFVDLFRTQLSSYEFTLLYYDALVGEGCFYKEIVWNLGITRKGNLSYLVNINHLNLYQDNDTVWNDDKMIPI